MIGSTLIQRYHTPVPRYTSYPPATAWGPMKDTVFTEWLRHRNPCEPLSLYVHVPFCHTICRYCGCFSIPNRSEELEEQYVQALLQEITLLASLIGPACVNQIHFGGGTPSKLSSSQMTRLMEAFRSRFTIDSCAEIAIEIDPRTVVGTNKSLLSTLHTLGFTRVSLGIQDFNESVQEAIGRNQSAQTSCLAYKACQEAGLANINLDLVYGLPKQTISSFAQTIEQACALHPQRLAFFSFAYLPSLKPNQRAIPAHLLPSAEEKFAMYEHARESLIQHGYVAIGLDHFALPSDPLCHGPLHRNFQGYIVLVPIPENSYHPDASKPRDDKNFRELALKGHEVIGLGISAISDLSFGYFQHTKVLQEYFDALAHGRFPTSRGLVLTPDDLKRRWVIEQLMCTGMVSYDHFLSVWDITFPPYFQQAIDRLTPLVSDGLVRVTSSTIEATPLGSLFLRHIAACFDTTPLSPDTPRSSL